MAKQVKFVPKMANLSTGDGPVLYVWGDAEEEGAIQQLQMCCSIQDFQGKPQMNVKGALMADNHIGYSMPIGGVIAYPDKVSPSGVGYDIACGNKAVKLDVPLSFVHNHISEIMDEIFDSVSFGLGLKNKETLDNEFNALLDDPAWNIPVVNDLQDLAREQLGTIGSGNHYVDIFQDQLSDVWVGVHFGSRGFGHKIATHYSKLAGGSDAMFSPPALLDIDSPEGLEYYAAMQLAGRYAYAGRDWVCQKVADIIGTDIVDEVHNHHNFTWNEEHGGRHYWVVRKGATPLFPEQRAFIGGSMGDISVIVTGKEHEYAEQTLYSTVHGAGRVMSRSKAAGKTRWKRGRKIKVREGEITRQMMEDWIRPMSVELRGAGTDESPHCYRRLPEVLAYHSDTLEVDYTLTPLGVAMAPGATFDPYKD